MTATQSLKIYEILQRHFKNENDAKTVVSEIESIIENKFEKEKTTLATKQDIYQLREDMSQFRVDLEKNTNKIMTWIIATIIAMTALIIAVIKL